MNKTKLTEKQVDALIRRRNAKYAAATPAQKRVMVAKDVQAAIATGAIKPREGTWVCPTGIQRGTSDSLQRESLKGGVACQCCGVGAVLLSGVRFNNRVNVADADGVLDYCAIVNGEQHDRTKMLSLFGENQIRMIELAFEQGAGYFGAWSSEQYIGPKANDAANFSKSRSPTTRLKKIMQNIIDNGGTFKPKKHTNE